MEFGYKGEHKTSRILGDNRRYCGMFQCSTEWHRDEEMVMQKDQSPEAGGGDGIQGTGEGQSQVGLSNPCSSHRGTQSSGHRCGWNHRSGSWKPLESPFNSFHFLSAGRSQAMSGGERALVVQVGWGEEWNSQSSQREVTRARRPDCLLKAHGHEFKVRPVTELCTLCKPHSADWCRCRIVRVGFNQGWSFANKYKERRDEQRSWVACKKMCASQTKKSQLDKKGWDGKERNKE